MARGLRRRTNDVRACLLGVAAVCAAGQAAPQDAARAEDWIELFDGESLDGWVAKLAGHELGDNYAGTFRAVDGVIRVSYEDYGAFGARFGHLFHREPYSHYRLALEYRFYGEQLPDAPDFATLNSGVMFHAQAPESILTDQNWPIAVEAQFLAGGRPTLNVCTPGTDIRRNGERVAAHCTDSTSRAYADDAWVRVEIEVLGAERVRHFVDGALVLEYAQPAIGGGVVEGYDPDVKQDGVALAAGFIGLQSEGQPVEFRNLRLLNLSGCMDPSARNYAAYFVDRDDSRCRYADERR